MTCNCASDAAGPAAPGAYRPDSIPRTGFFVVLEGISGSGKSTLAALLADRYGCSHFHTVPAPVSDLQPYINARARPLPQLAFYLAGALHASDLAREALQTGLAVADRYINSVIANHAAVHDLDNDIVAAAIAPFAGYLAAPDLTIYLHTDLNDLRTRMQAKADQTDSDRDLLRNRALLERLQDHYDQIARTDPTAYRLHTSGRTPAELAEHVAVLLPATVVPAENRTVPSQPETPGPQHCVART
jgi:thymidylate kinase